MHNVFGRFSVGVSINVIVKQPDADTKTSSKCTCADVHEMILD